VSRPTLSRLLQTALRMEAQLTAAGLTTLDARMHADGQVEVGITVAGAEAECDKALCVLNLPPASLCLSSVSVYLGAATRSVSSSTEAPELGIEWLTITARRAATDAELAAEAAR
jgi:hypothetical protein